MLKLSPQDEPAERTFEYERSSTSDLRFIVVTDLGIIAKRSSDGSHDVYVQSIGNGSPVADAQVDIIGRNGLPVSSGHTDGEGHVHFAKLDELRREKTPLMMWSVAAMTNRSCQSPVSPSSWICRALM